MKNKKLMMGALLSAVVMSGASAYDQADKDKCLANPDKVVWIESKGACIPKNPCENSKFSAYCVNFSYAPDESQVHFIINTYLKANNLEDMRLKTIINSYSTRETFAFASSSNYLVFDFPITEASASGIMSRKSMYGMNLCQAVGGSGVRVDGLNIDTDTKICMGVSEKNCKIMNGKYVSAESECVFTKDSYWML